MCICVCMRILLCHACVEFRLYMCVHLCVFVIVHKEESDREYVDAS